MRHRLLAVWWAFLVAAGIILGAGAPLPAEEVKIEEAQKKEARDKTEALPEIVVGATKTERNPADVPASITVITKEDIKRKNIQTTDEALQQVPGTFARRGKGLADTLSSVNLRGFPADGQKRTLVLVNGQDISTGYTNSVTWASIPVESIERIEVIRGPFSALYGGTAMGGLINIVTKMPRKLEMELSGGYGTYDSWTWYASVGHRVRDKFSFRVDYKYQGMEGYPTNLVTRTASTGTAVTKVVGWRGTTTAQGAPTYITGDSGDNSAFNHIISTRLQWDAAPGHRVDFTALFNWTGYGYGMPNSYLRNAATGAPILSTTTNTQLLGLNRRFAAIRPGSWSSGDGQEHTQVYILSSEHRLRDTTTLKLRAGGLVQPENWYTTPSSTSTQTNFAGGPGSIAKTPSHSWNVEAQVDQQVAQKHVLTGGLVYKSAWAATKEYALLNWTEIRTQTRRTYQSEGYDRTFAFYLQGESNWHPKLTTIVGVRLDWWQTYGGLYQLSATAPVVKLPSRDQVSVSPKFAVLYRPWEWWSWRASVGTAFRPPQFYELYRTWVSSAGTIFKANPYLKPETNLGWEVGTTVKPFKGTTITATLFQNLVDDLIYRVTDPTDPTGRTRDFRNAAEARILGGEMEITQKVGPWLELFANATLLNARIFKNPLDRASVGKKITFVPRQQFNFGANVNYRWVNFNLTGRYVSKMHTRSDNDDTVNNVKGSYDPFFTLDTKVTVTPLMDVNPALGKTYISFAVNNLLNRQYFYSYVTPGRTWWLQMGVKY